MSQDVWAVYIFNHYYYVLCCISIMILLGMLICKNRTFYLFKNCWLDRLIIYIIHKDFYLIDNESLFEKEEEKKLFLLTRLNTIINKSSSPDAMEKQAEKGIIRRFF